LDIIRRCSKCNIEKPLTAEYFHRCKRNKIPFIYTCKECKNKWEREYNQRPENKERAKIARNKPKIILKRRIYDMQKYYGINLEDRISFYLNQGAKCNICGKHINFFGRGTQVDHNHKTYKVRGLLCLSCNRDLGVKTGWCEIYKNEIEKHLKNGL